MKLIYTLMLVSLLWTPLAPEAARIPPVPEWPIIGPILVSLGLVEPVRYPDPSLPVYTITTMDELEVLDERIQPGERVRVVVAESLAQSILEDALKDVELFTLKKLDFTPKGLVIGLEIERARLEESGVRIPLIKAQRFDVKARIVFTAKDGIPLVKIRNVRVNGLPFPLGALLETRLNELSKEKWPSWLVLEAIFMSDTDVSIEGYYTAH